MPHSNAHTTTAEAVACLMWGPKTYAELMEFTGVSKWTIAKTMAALRQSGVVRVVRQPKGGYTVHLQTTPFALPDEGAQPVTSTTPYNIGRPRRASAYSYNQETQMR